MPNPFVPKRIPDVLPDANYLIDGVLPCSALVMLSAKPKARKTLTAIGMLMSILTGHSWCGRTVQKGHAIYVGPEGEHGLYRRVAAWQEHHLGRVDRDLLWFFPYNVNLFKPDAGDGLDLLIEAIRALGLPRVDFIVLDTLVDMLGEANENSAGEMARVMAGARKLMEAFPGSTVMLNHHTTKDGANYRGSSAIFGKLDLLLSLEKIDETTSRLEVEDSRDGDDFSPMYLTFKLQVVQTATKLRNEQVHGGMLEAKEAATKEADRDADKNEKATKAYATISNECAAYFEQHETWPNRITLLDVCKKAGLSENRFKSALAKLKEDKVIEATKGTNGNEWDLFLVGHPGAPVKGSLADLGLVI